MTHINAALETAHLDENDIQLLRKMCGAIAVMDLDSLQTLLTKVTNRDEPNSFFVPMSTYARCALMDAAENSYTTNGLEVITRLTYPTLTRFVLGMSIDEYRKVVFGRYKDVSWQAYIMASLVLLGTLVNASDDESWQRLSKSVATVAAAMD